MSKVIVSFCFVSSRVMHHAYIVKHRKGKKTACGSPQKYLTGMDYLVCGSPAASKACMDATLNQTSKSMDDASFAVCVM